MRSLRPWPRNEEDSRDTLATAEAFGVDRIIWIYENGDDFNGKAHELGFDIGTTMSANARESWIDTLSANEKRAHVDRFTIRNLEGAQVLPEHFKKFGGNPLVTHFVPDQINPEWQEYYINYLVGLYRNGVDSIHRDDPGSLSWAPRSGGSFTDAAVEYFRKYLQKHFTKGALLELGVEDATTFNIRDHFKSLDAPLDTSLWQWRGSPLMTVYLDAMEEADREFFITVKKAAEARTGKKIPWSLNSGGPPQAFEDAFDFRISEFQRHHNQPRTILEFADYSEAIGKPQAWVTLVDGHYASNRTYIAETRRNIATTYATGMLPLVPWCMYMHQAPRYYGSVDDFGDLFHFVSQNRSLFDGHDLFAATGFDTLSSIYSWAPNKEIVRPAFGKASGAVHLLSDDVYAFTRKLADVPDQAVVHLVDWRPTASAFKLSLETRRLVGHERVRLSLLRPGHEDLDLGIYNGAPLEIEGIDPWGILLVEALADDPDNCIPVPTVASPRRTLVPAGSRLILEAPRAGHSVLARFLPDGAVPESIPFVTVDSGGLEISREGVLEAYSINEKTEKQSATIERRYVTYTNFSAAESVLGSLSEAKSLVSEINSVIGNLLVNESFFGGQPQLLGRAVESSISTRGDAVMSFKLEDDWSAFSVDVGIDDFEDRRPSVRFQVWYDRQLAYESDILNPTKLILSDGDRKVVPIRLMIPDGVRNVQLRAVPSGFFKDQNTIIWCDPKLLK